MFSVILLTIISGLLLVIGYNCPPALILAGPTVICTILMWLYIFGII